MPHEIRVPRLGWSMEEGTFLRWLKNPGDRVQSGDVLYELESDKAAQEIETIDAGVLHVPDNAPAPGDVVLVGALLGYLLAEGEAAPQGTESPRPAEDFVIAAAVEVASPEPSAASPARPIQRRLASPRARRVARELGVDWSVLTGSGRNGRVREADVRQAAGTNGARAGATPAPALASGAAIPVSARRRAIASRMLASHRETAPVTLTSKVDATNLVNLRKQFKASSAGAVPGYLDVVVCLAAQALRRHPLLAARWEGEQIVLPPNDGFHIAIAVDTDAGLLAPVLKNAGDLTLLEVASRSRDLIARAQSGKLATGDLHGGAFTITNLGAYGIDGFTPIINYPETAILGLGAIRREAAVTDDDRLVARDALTLSLTFDHRVLDGAPAARFLQDLVKAVENPSAALLSSAATR